MSPQQKEFLTYVRTKQIFELRFKGEDAGIKPIHIKSAEIEERFFKFDRKAQLQQLADNGHLIIEKRELPNGYAKHFYSVTSAGDINFELLPAKPIDRNPMTIKMIEHLENVSLPGDAPRSDYFDVFLKYKSRRIDLFFTVDSFCGRVHTPVTSFHRDYRPNLMLYGERTASLDVQTSQPLILGKILYNAIGSNDFTTWIDSGEDVYVKLMNLGALPDRETAKKQFLKMLFSPDLSLIRNVFGESPWGNWITAYKSDPNTANPKPKVMANGNVSYHNNLAWLLQSTEVSIMKKIWAALIKQGIAFLSVHDELIVKESDLEQAHQVMMSVMVAEFKYFKISVNKSEANALKAIPDDEPLSLKQSLTEALNELANRLPKDFPAHIDGMEYPCLKTVVEMVREGWENNPKSKYFQDRIREIFELVKTLQNLTL